MSLKGSHNVFLCFVGKFEKIIGRMEPNYNHLGRTNTNQREIKK
jgi:hypothetical protein